MYTVLQIYSKCHVSQSEASKSGGQGSGAPTFFKAWAWPLHFCISYCVANIETVYFILKY